MHGRLHSISRQFADTAFSVPIELSGQDALPELLTLASVFTLLFRRGQRRSFVEEVVHRESYCFAHENL